MFAVAVPEDEYLSIDYVGKISPVVKLEMVYRDDDALRLMDIIRKTAYGGRKGDWNDLCVGHKLCSEDKDRRDG